MSKSEEILAGVTGSVHKLQGPAPRLKPESDRARAYAAASDRDRAWFAARPGRNYRLRPIDPAELALLTVDGLYATHIVVTQVARGFRVRRPVRIAGFFPDDNDPMLARLAAAAEGAPVIVGPGGRA